MEAYAAESMLPSDSAWRTRKMRSGSTRRSRGVAPCAAVAGRACEVGAPPAWQLPTTSSLARRRRP